MWMVVNFAHIVYQPSPTSSIHDPFHCFPTGEDSPVNPVIIIVVLAKKPSSNTFVNFDRHRFDDLSRGSKDKISPGRFR